MEDTSDNKLKNLGSCKAFGRRQGFCQDAYTPSHAGPSGHVITPPLAHFIQKQLMKLIQHPGICAPLCLITIIRVRDV
jgi:hypothetical protein